MLLLPLSYLIQPCQISFHSSSSSSQRLRHGKFRGTEQSRPVACYDWFATPPISAQLHIAHIISFILLTTWLKCKFLPSFYPFYMFYMAKTFSVHLRVRNHYTKRTLNLTLNRKKFLRPENAAFDKQKTAVNPPRTPRSPQKSLNDIRQPERRRFRRSEPRRLDQVGYNRVALNDRKCI